MLTDFLLARITEDEVNAQSIQNAEYFHGVDSDVEAEVLVFADPARVLAECESKREIAGLHESDEWKLWCLGCAREPAPCPTLRSLALPYSDHPDYREEWKP